MEELNGKLDPTCSRGCVKVFISSDRAEPGDRQHGLVSYGLTSHNIAREEWLKMDSHDPMDSPVNSSIRYNMVANADYSTLARA